MEFVCGAIICRDVGRAKIKRAPTHLQIDELINNCPAFSENLSVIVFKLVFVLFLTNQAEHFLIHHNINLASLHSNNSVTHGEL